MYTIAFAEVAFLTLCLFTFSLSPAAGFYVEGLTEYTVSNVKETLSLINMGLGRRAIAPTLINATSSRSHTVLTLTLQRNHYEMRNTRDKRGRWVDERADVTAKKSRGSGSSSSSSSSSNPVLALFLTGL